MHVVELKHNTPEWLEFRKSGIGGSEASAIMGCNPYKTVTELWEEKTGFRMPKAVSNNAAVDYGRNAEEYLAELFRLDFPQYELEIPKNAVFVDGCMFASLDGVLTDWITGRKGILEIKTAEIFASMHKEKWNNRIPQNYFVQVLHYLAVTGYDFAILKAQLKSTDADGNVYLRTKHYFIERKDVEEDIAILKDKEDEFWKSVIEKRRPNQFIIPNL